MLGAIGIHRARRKLSRAVRRVSRIARRQTLDDIGFGVTLIHQFAGPFADCNRERSALVRDTRLVESVQKGRVRTRLVAHWIGPRRCGEWPDPVNWSTANESRSLVVQVAA
jgi:hypothetical protein